MNQPRQKKRLHRSLETSFYEGIFGTAMLGFTENFWVGCAEVLKVSALAFTAALAAPLLLPSLAYSAERTMMSKAGDVLEDVKDTITEPIKDPKAAFSRWFDFNPEIESGKKKNYNILPLVIASPERGFGLGIKYAQEAILRKRDVFRVHALQTVKNKQEYRLGYEFPPEPEKKWGGEMEIGFQNFEEYYYGIGNSLPKENETIYLPELFEVRVPLLYQVRRDFFVGLGLNYESWKLVEVGREGRLRQDLPNLVGKDGARLYSTNFMLRWDKRNSKTNPSQGFFIEANQEYSKKLLGSETDFTRSTLELRQFYPILGNKSHVLGGRLFFDYKSGDVPFYLLPELGGVLFNRGLIEGRFRDNLAIAGNLEYRLKIYARLHWAFFVDAGNVYRGFRAITPERTKFTGGTGMRYYVPPGNLLLARVDTAYSLEGFAIYLTFDHPF